MPGRHLCMRGALLFAILGASPWISCGADEPESAAFDNFRDRVDQYLKMRKSAAPRLRPTKKPEEILEHRHELAEGIRKARSTAKQGDIFTPGIGTEFRRVIHAAFDGAKGAKLRKTIRQGDPVGDWKLAVNGDYPARLPMTTVPPTLLLHLPQLPAGVAYQIIGHDFVLEDTDARLIIDFLPDAIR